VALIDAIARFFAPPAALTPDFGDPIDRVIFHGREEERSLSWQKLWGSGQDTLPANTIAGIPVSAETAMNAPAVWACVRLISGAIAGLPLHAYRGSGNDRTEIALPEWIRRPDPLNPNITRAVHVQQVVTSLLLEGNAFIYLVGAPNELRVLDPTTVTIKKEGLSTVYDVKGADRPLSPEDILHIPYQAFPGKLRGLNPIDAARETIGLTIAAQDYTAAFFGNGATLTGTIEFPIGVEPTQPQIDELIKQFKTKHVGSRNSYAIGALTGGATYKASGPNNRDSQLNELREYQVEDVGRMYGVPPHMIGSQKPGAVAYASVEQRNIDFVTHGLQPVIEKLEDAYERVIRGQRTYFKFSVDGLLRGDAKSRWEAYGIALDKKVVLREEVRAKEDLPDLGPLGFLETPNNNPPEDPAPEPEPGDRTVVVNVPEQRSAPQTVEAHIHNHLPAPEVQTEVRNEVVVEPTPVTIENRVEVPAQLAPMVTVQTPDTLRIASMPTRRTKRAVTRRENGQVAETEDIETDIP
jgi:HK97 family phage portal protein